MYTEIKPVKGVRNDVAPERFTEGDLSYANSVDIDKTGKCYRRLGTTVLSSGAAHSAWSDGTQAFYVQNGNLNRFTPGVAPSVVSAVTGSRVAYASANGYVFWTDHVQSGISFNGENRQWGITPPAKLYPQAVPGNMPSGWYLCTMTYIDLNGVESGAPQSTELYIGSAMPASPTNAYLPGGGISINNLPVSADPAIRLKNIYVSACNGEVPLLMATIQNATTSIEFTEVSDQTIPVRTQFWGPPPPGQLVGYYKGRMYVADGPFLHYSQPYEFGLFDLRNGFVAFESAIQTFAAVKDGIFLGTLNKTVFLAGDDPDTFISMPISPVGTILGTEVVVPTEAIGAAEFGGSQVAGNAVLWASARGIVLGTDGGSVRDLTAPRFIPPSGLTQGGAFLKYRNNTPQYVATLS